MPASPVRPRKRRSGRPVKPADRIASPIILAALAATEAHAHMAGQSYLYLQVYPDRVSGRFELPLAEGNAAPGQAGTGRAITAANPAATSPRA